MNDKSSNPMKNQLSFWICFLLLLTGFSSSGQTDLLFSNSMNTAIIYNPALMEANDKINLRMSGRQQWVGFPDAPQAMQFSVEHFFEEKKMGVRLQVISQSMGKELMQRLVAAYAYRVNLSNSATLNFGLGAGIYQRSILYSQLIYNDNDEPLLRPDEKYLQPDFEFGAHLSVGRIESGLAINHLGQINRDLSVRHIPLHLHAYGTYLFDLTDEYRLRTGISYHRQGKVHYLQLDAQAMLGVLEAGLGWRNKDAFILKAGIHATENLEVHYSYDMGINKLATVNSGTHEVLIVLRIQKPERSYLSPRYLDY